MTVSFQIRTFRLQSRSFECTPWTFKISLACSDCFFVLLKDFKSRIKHSLKDTGILWNIIWSFSEKNMIFWNYVLHIETVSLQLRTFTVPWRAFHGRLSSVLFPYGIFRYFFHIRWLLQMILELFRVYYNLLKFHLARKD